MKELFATICGMGLFLYGVKVMRDSVQKVAGSGFKRIINALTNNMILAILVGLVFTFIFKSSSVTVVVVVSLVNSGFMNLTQAFAVIMGANIGSALNVSMHSINIMYAMSLILSVSVIIHILSSKNTIKSLTEVLIGFSVFILGLELMKHSLSGLTEVQAFRDLILSIDNPLMGFLTGMGTTVLIQSSSVFIGMLEKLYSYGLSINVAIPIICGSNVGTTTTALISSIGTGKIAKRAAIIHFIFNMIGSVLFILVLRVPLEAFITAFYPGGSQDSIKMAAIVFNVVNVAIQLPFYKIIIRISEMLIPEDIEDDNREAKFLDDKYLDMPLQALSKVKLDIARMLEIVEINLKDTKTIVLEDRYDKLEEGYQLENSTNRLQREISDYLVKLAKTKLKITERERLNSYLNIISDIERVGDHCENILEMAERKREDDVQFSDVGAKELQSMFNICIEAYKTMRNAYNGNSEELAKYVLELDDEVDQKETAYRRSYIDRLNDGTATTLSGIIFLDILSNLERISDHCSNIGLEVINNYRDN